MKKKSATFIEACYHNFQLYIVTFFAVKYFVCFFNKMGCIKKNTYTYLGNYWKSVLKLILSFLLGISDYGLDIVVLAEWFHQGHFRQAFLMVFFIILGGGVSVCYRVFQFVGVWNRQIEPHFQVRKTFEFNVSTCFELILDLVGLAFVLEFVKTVYSQKGQNSFVLSEKFTTVRIIESVFEALPSGALQLYILVRDDDYHVINVASVFTSALGFGFGVLSLHVSDVTTLINGTLLSYLIKARWLHWGCFWTFLASDFLLRSGAPSLLMTMGELEGTSPKVWVPICTLVVTHLINLSVLRTQFQECNSFVIFISLCCFLSFLSVFSIVPLLLLNYIDIFDEFIGEKKIFKGISSTVKRDEIVFDYHVEFYLHSFLNIVCYIIYFSYQHQNEDFILLFVVVCLNFVSFITFIIFYTNLDETFVGELKEKHLQIFDFIRDGDFEKVKEFVEDGNDIEIRNKL